MSNGYKLFANTNLVAIVLVLYFMHFCTTKLASDHVFSDHQDSRLIVEKNGINWLLLRALSSS